MSIENRKISGRQLGRMVIYDQFALPTLILPGLLAKTVGMDGFFVLAAGGVAGYALLLLLLSMEKRMRQNGQSFSEFLQEHFGSFLTCLILVIYGMAAWFAAAYGLFLLCRICGQYLIRDTSDVVILAVTAGLAVFALILGVECRGRMYELVFWFILLPVIFLFVMAAQNAEPDRWVPVFCTQGVQFIKHTWLVFIVFMGSFWLPMLSESVSSHADIGRAAKQSYLFGLIVNLVLFLLLTGIFGVPTVATMEDAVLTLTAMVKVPGGFFERQDALLCGIWLIILFAFVENALYALIWCAKQLTGGRKCKWLPYASGVIVFVLALCMRRFAVFRARLQAFYVGLCAPVLLGIVLVMYLLMKLNEKRCYHKRSLGREDNH